MEDDRHMSNSCIKYHFNIQDYNNIKCCGILLHQIGDLAFEEGGMWPEHNNAYYEFTYVLEGKGVVYTGNHVCQVEPGDCVLTIPGEKHMIQSFPGTPLRYAFTSFAEDPDESKYIELFNELKTVSNEQSARCVRNLEMQKLLFRLIQEIQNDLLFQRLQMGNLLVDLIILFLRTTKNATIPFFYSISDKKMLAYRIHDHLTKNYLYITTLADLEETFHYKYNTLEIIFKNIYGVTMLQYITKLKMEEAVKMLGEKISVTQISKTLQYSSIHVFSKSFRNYYGVSPSKYVP